MVTRLAGRGAEQLARFILTLAHDDNGIGDYVANFLAADDLPGCVMRLERTLVRIRRGERTYDRRHALDEVWLRRLDHLLDAIELAVLPNDPRAAFRLLTQVFEADGDVELFRQAGAALPQAEVETTVARLVEKDACGHRAKLRAGYR